MCFDLVQKGLRVCHGVSHDTDGDIRMVERKPHVSDDGKDGCFVVFSRVQVKLKIIEMDIVKPTKGSVEGLV